MCRKFAISARNFEGRRQAKKRRNRGGTWLIVFISTSRTFETDSDIHVHAVLVAEVLLRLQSLHILVDVILVAPTSSSL